MTRLLKGDWYIHVKSGNKYKIFRKIGIKLFGRWFWFVAYESCSMREHLLFIRTEKNFNKKFKSQILIEQEIRDEG